MGNNIKVELEEKSKKDTKAFKDKPVNVFGALFFITLGLVILLNNLGLLPWGIWSVIWRFWPIFLIMAGMQILARKSWLASIFIFGLGLGLIMLIITYSLSLTDPRIAEFLDHRIPAVSTLKELVPTSPGILINNKFLVRSNGYEGVEKVIIEMDLGAGKFEIQDTEDEYYLQVNADYYQEYGEPEIQSELEDEVLTIKLTSIRSTSKIFGGVDRLVYDIKIGNPDIPKEINIIVGAGKMNASLNESIILILTAELGAGKLSAEFNETTLPNNKMKLTVGAGSMNITLPQNTFARFNYKVGVGLLNIEGERFRGKGEYTLPNYSISEDPLPIDVAIGAGTVNINY